MSLKSTFFRGVKKLEAAAVSHPAHVVPGAVGSHVSLIQEALILIDGARISRHELEAERYGPSTASAVLRYKNRRAIINRAYQAKADNIVGKMTMTSLDQEMRRREQTTAVLRIACDFSGSSQT